MINTKIIEKILKTTDFTLGKLSQGDFPVSTDTRNLTERSVFICLRGENFDAFNFVEQIASKGCPVIVFEKTEENLEAAKNISKKYQDLFFVGVNSTLEFLQNLASLHKDLWLEQGKGREIIGLTGSNGKTTTKEILRFLLEEILGNKLAYTKGNYNNHIGVPLTLLSLESHHEVIVVEMGTNHHGEISDLCRIATPTAGLITNIGTGHIEHFKTQQEIYKEKKSLYDSILENKRGRFFIVNTDDEFLCNLSGQEKTIDCGEKAQHFQVYCDHQVLDFAISGAITKIQNKSLFGKHNYQDLALALSLCLTLYPEKKETLFEVARTLVLPDNNRSVWKNYSNKLVFLDAYNANPHSMRASLDAFSTKMKEQKIELDDVLFILGDMNELGDLSPEFHHEIGAHLASIGAQNVFFIGRFAQEYNRGYEQAGVVFADKATALKALELEHNKYKAIFLKASRSLQLESMTDIFLA